MSPSVHQATTETAEQEPLNTDGSVRKEAATSESCQEEHTGDSATQMPNNENNEAAERVASDLDADILLYNGNLERPQDSFFIAECESRQYKRENVLMVLVTPGGDASAAYRIARCLQRNYKIFTVFVPGYCKSAGTLLALGAHEIVFTSHGELGPLDVQEEKKDDLFSNLSGLTVQHAIRNIRDQTFSAFEKYFVTLMVRSNNRIALRTATKVASTLSTNLFAPLLAKLEPLYIGENARTTAIAKEYGIRLLDHSKNIDVEKLDKLILKYTSHDFVIDEGEANKLFKHCRTATVTELQLAASLGNLSLWPTQESIHEETQFKYLSAEVRPPREGETDGPKAESDKQGENDGTHAEPENIEGVSDAATETVHKVDS